MKHLTLSCRIKIEEGVNKGLSPAEIGRKLNKCPSSIRREIMRNATYKDALYSDGKKICRRWGYCEIGKRKVALCHPLN
ncbi:MAG: helix-turn-helix domain-containing protein [Streptococcaceae bacterium]|jgi:IS30 family transposase|nr:helix-turn-helix domain-containing protein [Streptococcaceae bacterium]